MERVVPPLGVSRHHSLHFVAVAARRRPTWQASDVPWRRAGTFAACFAFGALAELFKARGSWAFDLRSELGNLSAPWLVLPLLPALRSRSVLRGAATGLAATLCALAGFYVMETLLFLPAFEEQGGLLARLVWVFRGGLIWFALGLISGPVMGALGSVLGRRRSWVAPVVGALLVGEPLVLSIFGDRRIPLPPPLYLDWHFEWTVVHLLEVALGAALIVAFLARRPWRPAPAA